MPFGSSKEAVRALLIVVLGLVAVGIYAAFTGGPAHAAAPATGGSVGTTDFGYALAAGAIALAATILVSRPRMRFRR